MRNRALHDALRDFALEAAALLVRANEGGEELPFSLDEQSGTGGTLYRYRPLTDEFIADHWDELRSTASFETAARALGTGARAYLRRRGEPGADAEPALRAMLERLYEDATSFAFPEERFERVYAGVERALYAGTVRASVAAPVPGVRLATARIDLGEALAMVDVALLGPAPSPPWSAADRDPSSRPSAYLLLERDIGSDAPLPLDEARERFGAALTAVRLLGCPGAALGPLAFARAADEPWQGVRLGARGEARGDSEHELGSDEGAALAELVEALEDAALSGRVEWALRRFEMGAARAAEADALSDHLLAARALLGGAGGADPATIALRVAALRAGTSDRRTVQRRVEAAFALEPFVIEGGVGAARGTRYVEAVGRHGPHALIRDLEEHVRELLAAVVRGELDADLVGAADEALLRSDAPLDIRARRGEPPEGDAELAHDEPADERRAQLEATEDAAPARRERPARPVDGRDEGTLVQGAFSTRDPDEGADAGSAAHAPLFDDAQREVLGLEEGALLYSAPV